MSGICAVWRKENPGRIRETLAAVVSGLSLDTSERIDSQADLNAGVGCSTRFSTQQMYGDGGLLVVCDADLYNERELERLGGDKPPSEAGNRTAVLIGALYERYGTDFVSKLQGAFSMILWDRRTRRVLAAVDRFGIKRLVYYNDSNVFLIGSRIDALVRSGEIRTEINPRAVVNVLNYGTSLGPETIFTLVKRLPPGTIATATDRTATVTKYWDMCYGAATQSNEERLSRELEAVVERSVASHCKDDDFDSLGAFLSGGTDSSTVVGLMSRLQKGSVKAFSIGFQEQRFNELGYAEIAARKFRAEHHEYLVGPEDCMEALPRMVQCFDEPFANSSAIPTYFCARLAAQHGVETLLAGDGGDELFGGNERYLTDKILEIYHSVPLMFRKRLLEPVLAGLPFGGGLIGKARGYVRRANLPAMERFLSFQFLSMHPPGRVFSDGFLESIGGYSILDIPSRYYAEAPARHHLDRLLYADVKMTLGDSDLPKVTCMSELAGVQTRFPFLDTPVAEFSGTLPDNLKVRGFQKRYLFKKAFRNLLPIEIIRKTKHGFGIPVSTWIKSDVKMRELSHDVLRSSRAFERGYIRREFIEDLFRRHEADDSSYYGDALWTFLALELWHRAYVDQPAGIAV